MNQDQVATWEPDMPVKNKEPRAKKEERKRGRKENAIHTVKSAVSDGPPPDDAGPYHPNMDSEKDAEKWRNDGAGAVCSTKGLASYLISTGPRRGFMSPQVGIKTWAPSRGSGYIPHDNFLNQGC